MTDAELRGWAAGQPFPDLLHMPGVDVSLCAICGQPWPCPTRREEEQVAVSITLERRSGHAAEQRWADVRLSGPDRWVRFGVFYGTPPGSHIGLWRTRVDDLRGWNLRVGRRYAGPCLTMLAHWRTTAVPEKS